MTRWPISARARLVMRANSPFGSMASTEPSYISMFGMISDRPLPAREPAIVMTWRSSVKPTGRP